MGGTLSKPARRDDRQAKTTQDVSTRMLKIGSAVLLMAILIRNWCQRSTQNDSKMVGLHLLGWTTGGVALNFAVKLLLADWGEKEVAGSPMWSWLLSMCMQQFVFPLTMMAAGLHATPESTSMRRLCFFLFWSYITKDFFFPMSAVFVAHHLIAGLCMFLIVFFTTPDAALDHAVHSIIVYLEYGSLWSNLSEFFPKSKWVLAPYLGVMSVSNVYTIWLTSLVVACVSKKMGWVLFASSLILTGVRQKTCVDIVRRQWSGAEF